MATRRTWRAKELHNAAVYLRGIFDDYSHVLLVTTQYSSQVINRFIWGRYMQSIWIRYPIIGPTTYSGREQWLHEHFSSIASHDMGRQVRSYITFVEFQWYILVQNGAQCLLLYPTVQTVIRLLKQND